MNFPANFFVIHLLSRLYFHFSHITQSLTKQNESRLIFPPSPRVNVGFRGAFNIDLLGKRGFRKGVAHNFVYDCVQPEIWKYWLAADQTEAFFREKPSKDIVCRTLLKGTNFGCLTLRFWNKKRWIQGFFSTGWYAHKCSSQKAIKGHFWHRIGLILRIAFCSEGWK